MNKAEAKYTEEHEWVHIENNTATIGITHHAVDELGEIVFVELPEKGTEYTKSAEFGVVESVKTVSSLYSPLSGTVIETNESLTDNPEQINDSPYEKGWLIKLELNDPDTSSLMSHEEYESFISK